MVYCWKCGSQVGEQTALCPKCGATLRGTMGVQSPTGFELLRDDKSVQNHWARRVIAILIDAAIVVIGLGFPSTAVSAFPAWWAGWWAAWLAWASLVLFLYSFLAEGLYGRTLGKEIIGLRVERIDGKSMDLRSSFIRNISKIYWLLLVLDVAVGLGTHGEMSQKWSDRFIGTKVEAKTHMTIIP